MNLFKKIFSDPLIGRTVIHFTTHGCQATIHEFDYIGRIIDTVYSDRYQNGKFYKIEVLKSQSGEKRDNNLNKEFETVPSWYLQDLGGDFFVVYD